MKKKILNLIQHPWIPILTFGVFLMLLIVLYQFDWIGISTLRSVGGLLIYTIVAFGFFILLGYAGLASLGTAGFVGLGAYMTGYLVNLSTIPPLLILVFVILMAILLGLLIGFISLRIEGMYLAIITLGLSEILVELFKNLTEFTNGVNGLLLTETPMLFWFIRIDRIVAYAMIVILFIVVMILIKNIAESNLGRAMLAMKNSESAAQAYGISLLKYRLIAFVISTVLAMVGGYLFMLFYRFTIPTHWSLAFSLNVLAVVVIGGTKSIWGLFIGAFLIFGLNDIVLQNIDFFQNNPSIIVLINGAFMILIALYYPGGISQWLVTRKLKKQLKALKKEVHS